VGRGGPFAKAETICMKGRPAMPLRCIGDGDLKNNAAIQFQNLLEHPRHYRRSRMYSHQTESIASSLNKIMHLCVTLMQSPCQIFHIFFVVVYASLCEEYTSSEIVSII
jgi:hypothetical protein